MTAVARITHINGCASLGVPGTRVGSATIRCDQVCVLMLTQRPALRWESRVQEQTRGEKRKRAPTEATSPLSQITGSAALSHRHLASDSVLCSEANPTKRRPRSRRRRAAAPKLMFSLWAHPVLSTYRASSIFKPETRQPFPVPS